MDNSPPFIKNLEKSEKYFNLASHMTYVTFPLISDKKILLKILTETNNALVYLINAVLQYEFIYKRVYLSQNSKINLENFVNKSAPRFGITKEEIKNSLELIKLNESHKKSASEFVRKEKIIILSDNLNHETLTLERVKFYLNTIKNMLKKTKEVILS